MELISYDVFDISEKLFMALDYETHVMDLFHQL